MKTLGKIIAAALLWLSLMGGHLAWAQSGMDTVHAARLLDLDSTDVLIRKDADPVPSWHVIAADDRRELGQIASTWEVLRSTGYSGKPLDILVAVGPSGTIVGAELVEHAEPILTLGISDQDIADYVDGFAGLRMGSEGLNDDVPDTISRATVSTGVIRDSILHTARVLAQSGSGGLERVAFEPATWDALELMGAFATRSVTLREAAAALPDANPPIPDKDGRFLELWVSVLDPATIGQNLLGPPAFRRAMAALPADHDALLVASRGLHSHRGTAWRRSGVFDRVTVSQDGVDVMPVSDGYQRLGQFEAAGAPEVKEASLFAIPRDQIDLSRPFTVTVTATRDAATFDIPVTLTLGDTFLRPAEPLPTPPPAWRDAWETKIFPLITLGIMLGVLSVILFFQDAFVKRPKLWRWGRTAFLLTTFIWLGMVLGAQLSVVQVVAFLHSLLTGFRWEVFLMEPLIFVLWGFTALGLLFWGRGVFCGWLCPFGALQELLNQAAQRLGIKQIAVPNAVHERLWVIKYTLFLSILALSFYSMTSALVLAEAEPFKTAISMRFMRAWPFLLFVAALLFAGLFIERFYCRYLCPLGAALAIPAKLKIFDWLRRRPQCGRECRLCEQHCTVGAIDPLGKINPNECILCLRCQMIFHEPNTCTVLKRRNRTA
ncbi:NosR/NirI family protein [Marivita sp. S6314]|uniref:NosR/NirI family protein n=1 Tax=Marivita sp. S6314 TaxID=2926406 RepID=UPI001FF37F0C|nr:NosR/NirI family protein [Marivita sp. S6314]MCK0150473.1 NosR/NirI family protein [Marivita sp. S6314]